MRESRLFDVYGFDSTHDALDAEAALKSEAVDVVAIPAPKAIGTLCGIALRVPPEQSQRTRACLSSAGISVAATCRIKDV